MGHWRFTPGNTVARIAVIARRLHFDPTKKNRSRLVTQRFVRSVVGKRLNEPIFHPTSGVAWSRALFPMRLSRPDSMSPLWRWPLFTTLSQKEGQRERRDQPVRPLSDCRRSGGVRSLAIQRRAKGACALPVRGCCHIVPRCRESRRRLEDFLPRQVALLELFKSCPQAEIGYAVLDPDLEKAKRIFSIREILDAVVG